MHESAVAGNFFCVPFCLYGQSLKGRLDLQHEPNVSTKALDGQLMGRASPVQPSGSSWCPRCGCCALRSFVPLPLRL